MKNASDGGPLSIDKLGADKVIIEFLRDQRAFAGHVKSRRNIR